ncbi:MAG: FAD-dependent oxidoreductase [Candidatus Omnitrophica bacterium]|nr:FAD-dependent oxidoreductase [Candidatus Omnitrophota bacterium]
MADFSFDMVVIGGGAAGLTSSIWSAQLGSKTLLIEKEEKLGGDCLHYGCIPSKSLIKSANVYHLMKQVQQYGLPKVPIEPVDFPKVRDRIQGIIAGIQKHDSPEAFKKQYNIETRFGSPRFLDSRTLECNGAKITAKKIILATGSSARILPIEGLKDVPFITNVEIFLLDKLPASLIVLGGGPIGMEMAQSFSRLGSKVTVIEFADCILPKEDPDVSSYVHELLAKEGIEFFVQAKAQKVCKAGEGIEVTMEYQGNMKKVLAQRLLVATGRQPNVAGLDLEKAGVQYAPQGITVNRNLQTTAKNIYACGDCKGGFLFTHVAEYDARIAALNAKLPWPLLKTDYTAVPWCTFTDPEVACVGLNETMAQQAGIQYKVYKYDFAHLDRALAEGATQGFIKLLTDIKRKIIGAQIVGLHAGELIHEWVAAIHAKVDIGKIEKAMHVYPTLAQINKKVSGTYLAAQSPLIKIATYLLK